MTETPNLTRADAIAEMERLATELYRAEDRIGFVREMLDQHTGPLDPATVRAWLDHEHCPRVESEQQQIKRLTAEVDFTRQVLDLFAKADVHGDLLWHIDKAGAIRFSANVSDVFWWGCADAEDITPDRLPALQQAYDDLKTINAEHHLANLYAARARSMRPQGAAYPDEAAAQALFDACGPERAVELGNPKRPPQPITAITNHTFEGQPGTGQRCKADLFGETCGATWEQHEPRDCAHVYPGYSPPGEPPRCGPCIHCGTPFPDTAGG
jgi:hypothetical protein